MPRPILRTFRNTEQVDPEIQDAIAAEQYKNLSWPQQWGQNILDVGSGALAGALGLGDYSQKPWAEANPYERAGGTAQIITSLLPALGITRFLKPEKSLFQRVLTGGTEMVPDIEARRESTRAFINAYRQRGMGDVGEEIASRFPRVAAHADVDDVLPPRYGDMETVGNVIVNKQQKMPFRIKFKGRTPEEVKKTSFHELTHVAQGLGQDADLNQALYNRMRKFPVATGQMDDWDAYMNNPFEVSARHVAERKTDPMSSIGISPTRSMEHIKNYLDNLSPDMRSRFLKEVENEFNMRKRVRMIPGMSQFVDELPGPNSFKSDMLESIVKELDASKAPDSAYREVFSTGSKMKLKKGETWRGKLLDWIVSEKAKDKPKKPSFLDRVMDNPDILDFDPRNELPITKLGKRGIAQFPNRGNNQPYILAEEIWNNINDEKLVSNSLEKVNLLIDREQDPEIIKDTYNILNEYAQRARLDKNPDRIELMGMLRDNALDKLRRLGNK